MKAMRVRRDRGFTLVELTVVVAIIVALAAVVIPMVGSAKRDGLVAEMLQVVDSLRTACHKYWSDTGACALEKSDSTASGDHQLSLSQGSVAGWEGPYISQAISKGDNPFGGDIRVYNTFSGAYQGGFRLTSGSGSLNATGKGNYVRFDDVPEDIALKMDEALDDGISGDWKVGGRVTYSGGDVYVFLLDTDGE